MSTVLEVATPDHVLALAPRMRRDEVLEVDAALGLAPAPALRFFMRHAVFSRALFIGGELCTIFGIGESDDGAGLPWLLSSDAVERHPMAFWRASKLILAELRKLYPLLLQYVDARYTRSISWARRLGFVIAPAEPHGVAQMPFHPCAIWGL